MTCGFLFMCSGYYSYRTGYTPIFEGRDRFHGPIIHPQEWPEDFDHAGKRILVVGSGATAVTLVPAMAETARHVRRTSPSTSRGSRRKSDLRARFAHASKSAFAFACPANADVAISARSSPRESCALPSRITMGTWKELSAPSATNARTRTLSKTSIQFRWTFRGTHL